MMRSKKTIFETGESTFWNNVDNGINHDVLRYIVSKLQEMEEAESVQGFKI